MSTTTAVPTLKNFIDGALVDAEGDTEPVLNPATGEELARAALSTRPDVDRAVGAARRAFDTYSRTTPAERQALLLKLADVIEDNADELADLEARNAGKPLQAFKDDEIPFMADNLRFFAGAARCLEGKSAGEYLEGYTSIIRREPIGVIGHPPRGADRRHRPDRAVELPADDGRVEVRPGAGDRQHRRAQAGRDDAD